MADMDFAQTWCRASNLGYSTSTKVTQSSQSHSKLGYIGIMEKKMETTIVYWDYIGMMDKKMETTIVYWDYIGIMEKKMETTIVYWGYGRLIAKQPWYLQGSLKELQFPV